MRIKLVRELLGFSRKERSGIIVLLLVIFLLILFGKLIPLFISSEKPDFSAWEAEVNTYLIKTEPQIAATLVLNLVSFDPNKVDSVSLSTMGLPERLSANWLKYLQHGGRFRDKEGVNKIYGMTPEIFEQLEPFILFSAQISKISNTKGLNPINKSLKGYWKDTSAHTEYQRKEKIILSIQELNSTDSINLLKIPGIGSVLASRIIRYRNLLGGFYDISQIKEVYGLRSENFTSVSAFLRVDASVVKTLNINFSTVQDLGHHPYIGFRTARKLIRQRDKKGMFLSANDLSVSLGSDSLKRLIPYLRFSE